METWRKLTVNEDAVLLLRRLKYSYVVFPPRRVDLNTLLICTFRTRVKLYTSVVSFTTAAHFLVKLFKKKP